MFRTMVRSRTGWGSTEGELNLSTHTQEEKVIPDWGGKRRSPTKGRSVGLVWCTGRLVTKDIHQIINAHLNIVRLDQGLCFLISEERLKK